MGTGARRTLSVLAGTGWAQEELVPGALAPVPPSSLEQEGAVKMQSWQILFHFILRSARNLGPGDNLSLFSPNSAWRCRGLMWDGTVSTPNQFQNGCRSPSREGGEEEGG